MSSIHQDCHKEKNEFLDTGEESEVSRRMGIWLTSSSGLYRLLYAHGAHISMQAGTYAHKVKKNAYVESQSLSNSIF